LTGGDAGAEALVKEGGDRLFHVETQSSTGITEGDHPVSVIGAGGQIGFEADDESEKAFAQDETGFARFARETERAETGVEFVNGPIFQGVAMSRAAEDGVEEEILRERDAEEVEEAGDGKVAFFDECFETERMGEAADG
jgi:hypothetical protein